MYITCVPVSSRLRIVYYRRQSDYNYCSYEQVIIFNVIFIYVFLSYCIHKSHD